MQHATGKRILDRKALQAKGITYSNVHLLRLERQDRFPKRIHLSDNRVGWLDDEVDAWIDDRAAERDALPASVKQQNKLARARDRAAERGPAVAPKPAQHELGGHRGEKRLRCDPHAARWR